MGRRALSPATQLARETAKVERQHAAKAARDKLIQDRKAYSNEIRRLAVRYAPPKPQLQQRIGEKHNWTAPMFCLGMSKAFENIGQWFHKVTFYLFFPVYTRWTYLHLIYSKCKGHGGQSCSAFEWLSNPLNQRQLSDLKRLWVLHDQLGKKYGKTSPSGDLIREVLSSEQRPSTPLPINLPTPPLTQPSKRHHDLSQDIPLLSPLATRLSKRCRSPSPTIVLHKRMKLDGNPSSTRLQVGSTSQATGSSSRAPHEIIDLSLDSDEDDKGIATREKGCMKEKKQVRAISLGENYLELFDSDEDSYPELQ